MGDQELSGDAAREAAVSVMSRRAALLAAAGVALPVVAQQEASALERIRARGRLSVAVYQELPPFSVGGEGMDDDLRNMVWRGHYLGFGPADVMLHVPVDAPLMRNNPRWPFSRRTTASGW